MVFFDPRGGIADETNMPRGKIVQPAEIVADLERFGMGIKRIDGEIAPRGVVLPLLAESDRRAAPVFL